MRTFWLLQGTYRKLKCRVDLIKLSCGDCCCFAAYRHTHYIIKLQVYQSPQLNCTYACELLSFSRISPVLCCVFMMRNIKIIMCMSWHAAAAFLFYEWSTFFHLSYMKLAFNIIIDIIWWCCYGCLYVHVQMGCI